MSLIDIKNQWKDREEFHQKINEEFIAKVNNTPQLKELRDWVESKVWGFGERSFYWMWKLLVDEMPIRFNFMEIGVFRGQILALISLLAEMSNRRAVIEGISPLNAADGYWESDYRKDIEKIHEVFNLRQPKIIEAYSTDPELIKSYNEKEPYLDLLYIDGGHTHPVVAEDLKNYPPLLKKGGYLVIDDSAKAFHMPFGYFQGHDAVSRAVDETLPPFTKNQDYEFYFNVVHNRIWKKI